MKSISGIVLSVDASPLGSELVDDAPAGSLTIAVLDASDFDEDGVTARIGGDDGELVSVVAADPEADVLTLAQPLADAWDEGTRVDVYDTAGQVADVEYRALVTQAGDVDNDDALDVLIAHPVVGLLVEGVREPGDGESVTLTQSDDDHEWVLTDVVGKLPAVRGEIILPGTIDRAALSFTADGVTVSFGDTAPDSPNVGDLWYDGTNGYQMNQWDGAQWVPYQIGSGAIAPGSITPALIDPSVSFGNANKATVSAVAPTPAIAGDLWYDSSNGNRLNSYNGAAWVPVSFGIGAVGFTARDIGGVTTSFGSPAPSNAKAGDLWYDSANGYKLNRYDGAAWAAVQYGTNALAAGSVTAALIAAHSITATQIAAGTVTATEVKANTITAAQIAANTITAGQLAANTITAGQILAGTITANELSANSVTAAKIVAGAIDATKIAAGTITGNLIAAGTITGNLIAAGVITANLIAARTITATQVAAGAITANEIAANTITANQLAVGLVVAEIIKAGTIDAFALTAANLTGASIQGTMTGGKIQGTDFLVDTNGGRLLLYNQGGAVAQLDDSTPGTRTWTPPAGVTRVKVETWGSGGGGDANAYTNQFDCGAAGGGGGEYAAEQSYTVVPGTPISYTVGAGGAAGTAGAIPVGAKSGGNTTFGTVVAHGGKAAANTTPGAGGTSSTNTVHFSGGRGAYPGINTTDNDDYGGGGAASAGSINAGPLATFRAAAIGINGGANGGNGGIGAGNGAAGAAGGGGGGGSGTQGDNGGNGGAGRVKITSYATTLGGSIASAAGVDPVTNTAYPAGFNDLMKPDTGWLPFTGVTGWTITGGQPWQARQIGNVVYLRGGMVNGTYTGTYSTVGQLPAAITPPSSLHVFSGMNNTTIVSTFLLTTTGALQVYRSAASASGMYLTGANYLTD